MKARAIKGLAVVSIDTGAKLGYVDNVLFDTSQLVISAFRIDADGQQAVVPFDQVRSIGTDAVTIPNNDVVRWPSAGGDGGAGTTLDDLEKRKIVDEAGDYLGTVTNVEVDPQEGRVTHLQAHKGGILGIGGNTIDIDRADVISVGDEVMVVRVAQPTRTED